MNAPTTFPTREQALDGCYLCSGCDRPRPGILAYCPDCEETTRSYLFDAPYGSVTDSALVAMEADTLADCARINIARRLDELAARRRAR